MVASDFLIHEAVDFPLPFNQAQPCYDRLAMFPELALAYHEEIKPLATIGGDLAARLHQIELLREHHLTAYLESGNSLREADTALNCCIADLYYGLFDTLSEHIYASDFSAEDRIATIRSMLPLLDTILDWNTGKRSEININLDGLAAEIELDELEEDDDE